MAKALETILILGVVVVGGYVAFRFLQGKGHLSWVQGVFGPAFTRNQYIASPTTPGALTPVKGGTPESRAQSTGGGVGGPGYVAPNAPPSNTILTYGGGGGGSTCPGTGKSYARCPNCKSLCNSPGTFDGCCRAQSNLARRSNPMKSFMAWSKNAVSNRITVV